MKYALFEGHRIEPKKGLRAVCPYCENEVISKCGSVKMHHWAHKNDLNCDIWKENELQWHRNWKNQFPAEWQERIFTDTQTGEKHIADVCTDNNFIIEFQHSPISEEEKVSRETFYKEMCWIVDASGVRFRKRFFEKGLIYPYTQLPGFYFIDNPPNALPPQWLQRNSFVFLDFKGDSDERQFDDLWCLVPTTVKTTNTLALRIARIDFVEMTKNNVLPSYLISLRDGLSKTLEARKKRWHL
ncbi:Competence protein CoiA-like family protein [Succinivibrio dextrinosolvens DSM 3072]|uniref:Competence protein CoiA-like family protein n=1 Tax=Succinivibrio dextrinosolvens DSM 3072 TaxID=1123324 RepID=A0A1T4V167_9GAMM|nr:competence protein CoiA family protein [Succinivibrio dextrinosolvens]SKA58710.1 Competence protein CoiA-like family protein [Succinivibrio dextrinosolvens DSM 3072]